MKKIFEFMDCICNPKNKDKDFSVIDDQEDTLYKKLGGEPAMVATADILVTKLSKDYLLSDYFSNIDLITHKVYLKKYLLQFTGGPKNYDGRDLRIAHHYLDLDNEKFDHFLSLIKDTLNELSVNPDLVQTFRSSAETLRREITNK